MQIWTVIGRVPKSGGEHVDKHQKKECPTQTTISTIF